MNRIRLVLTAFVFAASFTVSALASAQVSESTGGPNYGFKAPAVETDPASAVRGSLGVSLETVSLDNGLGKLVFLLNGGLVLLSGGSAFFAVVRRHRKPILDDGSCGDWRAGNPVTSI
jgi:hypothetical protein